MLRINRGVWICLLLVTLALGASSDAPAAQSALSEQSLLARLTTPAAQLNPLLAARLTAGRSATVVTLSPASPEETATAYSLQAFG